MNAKQAASRSLLAMGVEGAGLLLALLFDAVMAATFGASAELDTFFVALTIPQLLLGALTANGMRSIAPMLQHPNNTFSQTLGGIISWSSIVLVVGVGTLAALSQPIVRLIAFGLSAEQQQLTAQLLQLLLVGIIPLALSEPLRACCVWQERAGLATASNLLRYGTALPVFLLSWQQLGVAGLALALTIGSFAQALLYGVIGWRLGWRFRPNLDIQTGRLLWHQLAPPTAGDLLSESGLLTERLLASLLPTGTVSAFGFARRILSALYSLLNNAILVVYMPALSRTNGTLAAKQFRQHTQFIISITIGLSILFIFSTPFALTTFLGHGQFSTSSLSQTIQVSQIFATSMPLKAVFFYLLLPHLAAFKGYKLLEYALLSTVSFIAFELILFWWLDGVGLAMAQTISLLPIILLMYRQTRTRFAI